MKEAEEEEQWAEVERRGDATVQQLTGIASQIGSFFTSPEPPTSSQPDEFQLADQVLKYADALDKYPEHTRQGKLIRKMFTRLEKHFEDTE